MLSHVDSISDATQTTVYLPGNVGAPGARVAARGALEGEVEGVNVGLNVVGFDVGERDGAPVRGLDVGACEGDALGVVGLEVGCTYRSTVM